MTSILAWVGSLLLSMGIIYKFFSKWSPKIRWSLKLINEVHDVVETMLRVVEDRKITKQEVRELLEEIDEVREILEK